MTTIAINGVPFLCSLKHAAKLLWKYIRSPFQTLNFAQLPGQPKNVKTLYILVEKMDPEIVLQRLKNFNIRGRKLHSYIPKQVPNLTVSKNNFVAHNNEVKKNKKMIRNDPEKPDYVMTLAHAEIMAEMQYKYTGLYELSKKNGHTLLEEITHTIFERLKLIMDRNPNSMTSFNLSKAYRRAHPHFADFQMILSTLQKVQDVAGTPRTIITEQDITVINKQPCQYITNFSQYIVSVIGNIPYKKVKASCNKYTEAIVKKVTEHVDSLDTTIQDVDAEEEIAKKKVRAELKKLTPYLNTIIREVVTENFVPERSPYHRFRIYGEPFLPPKETMAPFLKRYHPVKVVRSDRMYNLLKMYISLPQYGSIMAMDGTVVDGAKLVIRPSEQMMYKIPESFVKEMRSAMARGYRPSEEQA
ncbi:uncharacterized protein LOC106142127 [Amyelois transitella]|uniref:uncharacterized protein LOC106142127 n=1 Tax=Amyelois transitella TaxID=680683 RepID=UPI00298F8B0F|nr:uncharacterized protein LOC106142127 [Amyelois transitella]